MRIYPAIDLYEGKVVRLTQGDFQKITVYSDRPADFAAAWEEAGTEWIHVVDLEGAKTGVLKNFAKVQEIRSRVKCKIQLGGGLRTETQIQQVLDAGIDRAVIGTKALDEAFLKAVLGRFRSQIAVGLDVREGIIQTQGWQEGSGNRLEDFLERLNLLSAETVIYTDIQKDGMLKGPDFTGLRNVLSKFRGKVILSGGVGALSDVEQCAKLKQTNFEGVIIGKALYDKKFELRDALGLLA